MTIATVREAIHERLDPVIEEIVTREISQRGGGYARGLEQEGGSFQALMPVLLSTIMQRRQAGPEGIEAILPLLLPTLIQQRRPGGAEQTSSIQAILPLLLSSVVSRRQAGPESGIEAILPLLLSSVVGRRQAGQEQGIESILPLLLPTLMQRRQAGGMEQEQEHPLQTLAPVLVAALSAR